VGRPVLRVWGRISRAFEFLARPKLVLRAAPKRAAAKARERLRKDKHRLPIATVRNLTRTRQEKGVRLRLRAGLWGRRRVDEDRPIPRVVNNEYLVLHERI
jgi:hypothetical protein